MSKFDIADYTRSESLRKLNKLKEFSQRNDADFKLVNINGSKFLIIDLERKQKFSLTKLAGYSQESIKVKKRRRLTGCFFVAQEAINNGVASGRIFTNTGADDLVDYDNHCINFDEIADGTVVGFDLTAYTNVDHDLGNYDVVLLRATNLEELQKKLGELYGGEWHVMQDD